MMFDNRTDFSRLIKAGLAGLLGVLLLLAGAEDVLSQTDGVEISPSFNRQVSPGQVVVYDHVLTNHTMFTDTFALQVHSTQGWPVALLGEGYPGGTLVLPLQVGAQMTASFQLSLTVPPDALGVTENTVIMATSQISSTVWDTETDTTVVLHQIYLPFVAKRWPPVPYAASLEPIDNSDQDNVYTVSWTSADLAQTYILEEATRGDFSDAQVVYQGADLSWSVPAEGQTPGDYYYRVKARNAWGDGSWSHVRTVTVHPLFVGLQLQWDGEGYLRGSESYDMGLHQEKSLDSLTDADTVHIHNHNWYDPNPLDFDSSVWDSYYAVTTGYFKSRSVPQDPSWKWSYPWILPYDWTFSDGQTISIEGQAFLVSGPHAGETAFGQPVQYWQVVNRDKFLLWDDGGDWAQYVHAGDVMLQYDAGPTRLLLHSDVLRRFYYKEHLLSDTVHYITDLVSANAFSESRVTAEDLEDDGEGEARGQVAPFSRDGLEASPRW